MSASNNLTDRLRLRFSGWQNRRRIARLARQVELHAPPPGPSITGQPGTATHLLVSSEFPPPAFKHQPIVLFNASTRITGLSLNAAFQLLTGWSLRLAGAPVIHFVCQAGMQPCVLGINRQDYSQPPPCAACQAQSRRLHAGAQVYGFTFRPDAELSAALQGLSVEALSTYSHPFPHPSPGAETGEAVIPLGELVLPSVRWTLRRHNLPDDEPTRYLLRQYILSACNVALQFAGLLAQAQPRAAVIFNGMMFPEAAARWVARLWGVRNVAHEVGFQRFSTFFTEGEPTAYPIHIPQEFELSGEQNARLDAYLEQRFQGKFSMAGIQFWPEMRGLDAAFLQKASGFKQIVPVFTNVIYDTSQVHANVIFPHMFAWLEVIAGLIRRHPETLFIIRAHPDEFRPGTAKQSNESVHDWVRQEGIAGLPNVVFIDSQEYVSSYELIQRSSFVIVYNSSIGLEAALLGKPVLCGGRARYTQYPTVFFPQTRQAFAEQAEEFLSTPEIHLPPEFQRNARRFLYYQLYRASLPLDEYLQTGPRPGFVLLRDFSWERLLPHHSASMQVLHEGILDGKPFLMPEN